MSRAPIKPSSMRLESAVLRMLVTSSDPKVSPKLRRLEIAWGSFFTGSAAIGRVLRGEVGERGKAGRRLGDMRSRRRRGDGRERDPKKI